MERLFEPTEQRVYDQARAIGKNGWLSQLELEIIKRQVEDEYQGGFGGNAATAVETVENEDTVENEVESVAEEIVNVEKVNNNVIDNVDDPRDNPNDERRKIVERLNEIMLEGKTSDSITFKKVDKKALKFQTDIVNDAINYFKGKNVTETNYLIKAASVWVAEHIGLKKRYYRGKKEPRWKRRIEERHKETETSRKLFDKRLEGRIGIEEETKNEITIWKI